MHHGNRCYRCRISCQILVPVEDVDVSKQLATVTQKSRHKSNDQRICRKSVDTKGSGKTVKATVKTKKGEEIIEADVVLSAVGIVSNIEGIGLEDVGIVADKGKIMVNDFYQTNIPGYYAIGDVTPGQALAHVASAEGITCVEKIAGHASRSYRLRKHPRMYLCNSRDCKCWYDRKASKRSRL